jgi:hypothetical protein
MALVPFTRSPLQKAMQRFVRGAELEQVLESLDDEIVESKRDAEAVAEALRQIARVPERPDERYRTSPLQRLVGFFQQVENDDAAAVLREKGGPELVRIFRASFPPREDDHDDLPFLLKVMVMFCLPEAGELLAQAVRHPQMQDAALWPVVLQQLDPDHPDADAIVTMLSDPLPQGFAGAAFLALANERALAGIASAHPFDTAAGLQQLEVYLTDADPEKFTHAMSAAAAIPYLRTPARQRLLDIAWTHENAEVQLEAFRAAATLGEARGVAALAEAARDPRRGPRPLAYLEELGHLEAAPPETQTEEHLALATMADWLAYPTEFNAFPDALRVVDTRELSWPPTNDRRRLWLIEFTYEPNEERETREVGIGMVGSITFALFGSTSPEMPPEDLYAIHCVWELQANEDPRAPEDLDVTIGRELLGM